MSAENDVPLGEGARRYYDQQFGDRIRKVNKGSGSSGRGGSNWNGRAGAGIGLTVGIAFIVIRILLAVSRTSSYSPSYTYTPPPNFNVDFQKQLNDVGRDDANEAPQPDPLAHDIALLLQPADQVGDPFFTDEDVPFPQGLCYRIQQESQQQRPTPGKRICQLATAAQKQLITKAASGQNLSDKEQADLRATWNAILRNPNFYDSDSFALIQGVPFLMVAQELRDKEAPKDPLFNRLLLEKCYPQQIIPLRQRDQLNGPTRAERRRSAQADLEAARQR